MIEDLNLTSREEKTLRSVLGIHSSETVIQFVRRKGVRGILWLVMVVLLSIGAPLAVAFWSRFEEHADVSLIILLLFIIIKIPEEIAKDRLIRKLYHALEVRGGQGSQREAANPGN